MASGSSPRSSATLQPAQILASLEEVAMRFRMEEHALLDPRQKALYRKVMRETYRIITNLGNNQNDREEELPVHQCSIYPCSCGKNFITKKLIMHEQVHPEEKCLECGITFEDLGSMLVHQIAHSKESEKSFN